MPRPRTLQACPLCGVSYLALPASKACSRSCAQTLRYADTGHPACEVCGTRFRRSYAQQRTCSRRCGMKLQVANRPPAPTKIREPRLLRACSECRAELPATGRVRVACSRDCSNARAARLAREARRARGRSCRTCGVHLDASRLRSPNCAECSVALERASLRRCRSRRRARERLLVAEHYTLAEIAARDRFTCGICRKRVAMTKIVPHPKAPTIDHLIPISEGGDDVKANVRLAHFLCNSVRGNRGGNEQLLLVG